MDEIDIDQEFTQLNIVNSSEITLEWSDSGDLWFHVCYVKINEQPNEITSRFRDLFGHDPVSVEYNNRVLFNPDNIELVVN